MTINRLMLKFLPRIFPSSAFTFELFDLSAIVARFIPEIASLRPHFTATNLEVIIEHFFFNCFQLQFRTLLL